MPMIAAEGDELAGVAANAQMRGGDAEQQQADHEDPLAAVPVAEDAPGEQQRGEHEDVGVDRPDELALRGAQVLLDRRQRDVEDGVVEDDDQQAHDEDAQDGPAARVAFVGGGVDPVAGGGRRCRRRGGVAHGPAPSSRAGSFPYGTVSYRNSSGR